MNQVLRTCIACAVAMALVSLAQAGNDSSVSAESKKIDANPVHWKDMNPAEFGCFLEKTTGFKDAKFNCSRKNYAFSGAQPCTPDYYEHPDFPIIAAQKIHPQIRTIEMEWAGGRFLAISFGFPHKSLTQWEILEAFGLPRNYSTKKADADGITFSFGVNRHAHTDNIYFRFNRGNLPECGED